jgi:hypothetical protein
LNLSTRIGEIYIMIWLVEKAHFTILPFNKEILRCTSYSVGLLWMTGSVGLDRRRITRPAKTHAHHHAVLETHRRSGITQNYFLLLNQIRRKVKTNKPVIQTRRRFFRRGRISLITTTTHNYKIHPSLPLLLDDRTMGGKRDAARWTLAPVWKFIWDQATFKRL